MLHPQATGYVCETTGIAGPGFCAGRAHGIVPVRRGHPAYQYMNDADGDGVVCE